MHLIDHGHEFGTGTRVVMLKGRYKDGLAEQRTITRVTHSMSHWKQTVEELAEMSIEGERIYATAGERCLLKASRRFKETQLQADYDDDPMRFYKTIEARWASCLMQGSSQKDRVWLFDIDSEEERAKVDEALERFQNKVREYPVFYSYPTKNGRHYLSKPFNKSLLPDDVRGLLSDNALALIGY